MRIENLRSAKYGKRARISADLAWEDCKRSPAEIFFETDEAFSEDLTCNPDSFLLAAAFPAMHFGERRVKIDAPVCPELKTGLVSAMTFISHWFQKGRKIPDLETGGGRMPPDGKSPDRAGFFFSGGVDSFATLRANRLNYPPEHPLFIKDAIVAYGLEMDDVEAFGHVVETLSRASAELGLSLIPVYTNIYLPYRDEDERNNFSFWENEFMGAALASIAHAFSNRLSTVSISATFSLTIPVPFGTHPLIDPNFSSTALKIRHEEFLLTRLAKTKMLSSWEPALRHMRVCNNFRHYKRGMVNCCNCEKCIRTMLELMVSGVLDRSEAFSRKDITEELVMRKTKISGDYTELSYKELIGPLSAIGRHDLVRAVKKKLARYAKEQRGWKARLKRFDDERLNGRIVKMKRMLGRALEGRALTEVR